MKTYTILSTLCLCLVLSGCITEYEATGIDEAGDILVVEGIITDDDTYITLSRSVYLNDSNPISSLYNPLADSYVNNAEVYVECDDGTQTGAQLLGNGRYLIATGKLDLDRKYRLKIGIEEHKYYSDYSPPIKTPEIDSIFYIKKNQGQPIYIYVSTRDPGNETLYYRWWYEEDWEINSVIRELSYPYYCWNKASNKTILIGAAVKSIDGVMMGNIAEIKPSDKRLSVLYRIKVKQNAISKRAYDYFLNIKKNTDQIGSIFAPIPSELRGNITCTSDPNRPVIGYMDVSVAKSNRRFISHLKDNLYEQPYMECPIYTIEEIIETLGYVPNNYIRIGDSYVRNACVDCRYHGNEPKPDDWPNDH